MKALSTLIKEYKACPNAALKEEIFNRVIWLNDLGVLDQEEPSCDIGDWFVWDDNIRIRQIGSKKYLIADVFSLPGGSFLCYSYEIDLDQFTDAQTAGYRMNCSGFAKMAPNADAFTAFAIAKGHDATESCTPYVAVNDADLQYWYERL